MQESDQPTKPASPSPEPDAEQLLKILDLQRQARPVPPVRASPFAGQTFRYASLIVIVVGTLVAVAFLEWFVTQLPHPVRNVPPLHGPPSPSPGLKSSP